MGGIEQGGEMTCEDDTHVFLVGSLTCQCGVFASQPYPLSGGIFPGYNPYGPPRPPTPPVAGQAPPIGVAQFKAAQSILEATHLSADGERVYIQMSDGVRVCYWDEEAKRFGSSFPCFEGLPADAVKM